MDSPNARSAGRNYIQLHLDLLTFTSSLRYAFLSFNKSKITLMQIGLLIIGDEILSGRRQDKHLGHCIEALGHRQLQLDWVCMARDDAAQLQDEFLRIRHSGDLCFSFGGIGATPDDISRQCVAAAWEVDLYRHPDAVQEIETQFGEGAYPQRILMAELPQGSVIIPNPVNRVPGFSMDHLHCLPGFPEMAWPMLEWVLDTRYHDLASNKDVEFALVLDDAHESELITLMESLLARHPAIKLFSLPRFVENDRHRLELGVKGERDAASLAYEYLKQALASRSYTYTEQ
jgi:molybdopterin-biosynthesis enzyme MoeA-like protein